MTVPIDDTHDETAALVTSRTSLSDPEPPVYGTAGHEDLDLRMVATESEDVEADEGATNETNNQNDENEPSGDDDNSTSGDEEMSGTIGTLTRRLRCMFSTITWPIVPLGTIVALALLWVLYAASSLDLRRSCSHPLHWYALSSLVLVAYIPQHAQVRSHLFQYTRERDGPIRPTRVRMYDQFFHTICLLYVYTGVTLLATCRDDVLSADDLNALLEEQQIETFPSDAPLNSCAATCPNLYQALSVYIATLEMFTFALILPLLFLPCIYLWFLRRATVEAENFAQLHDRLQEDEALLSNGGVTVGEILDTLEHVKLISRDSDQNSEERQLYIVPTSDTGSEEGTLTNVKECCICMNEFEVQTGLDVESGSNNPPDIENAESDPSESGSSTGSSADVTTEPKEVGIVRTQCGHLFHKQCLSGWVSGRWQRSSSSGNDDGARGERRERRARQTGCPLCRESLRS